MARISIRRDEQGGQAVCSDGAVLMDGLGESEARSFAAFFRAASRSRGARTGQAPDRGGRGAPAPAPRR